MEPNSDGKKQSRVRILLKILFVLPVGYVMFKANLPHLHFTILDATLIVVFPVLVAIASLIDTWDRTASFTRKVVKCTLILITALIMSIGLALGKRMNQNPVLGMLLIGLLLMSFSAVSFYFGSFQYRDRFRDDANFRRAYHFSTICFIFSLFQVPFWVMLTGQFPPEKFTSPYGEIAIAGVILGIMGPAAPWIMMIRRYLIEMDRLSTTHTIECPKQGRAPLVIPACGWRESMFSGAFWIPAYAGMTVWKLVT